MKFKAILRTIIVFFNFFLVMLFTSYGQVEKQIIGVKGEGIIAGKVSEADARKEAINRAKIEALRKAGISESISSYQMLFKSESENNFSEFFSSDVQTEIQGAVKEYYIVKEERKSYEHYFRYEVTLDATVIIYNTRPDATFNVNIEGIKTIYESGEGLSFTIQSTKDCFLHIFSIDDDVASLVYPNPYEEYRRIVGLDKVKFPYGSDYDLFTHGDDPVFNGIVFVLTKEEVRFWNYSGDNQTTSAEKIFSWVYSLTPDMRVVQYKTFTIR